MNETPLIFNTATEFSKYIETTAADENKSLIHIILRYCEDRDIDPRDIAKYVNKSLKDKLEVELQNEGLLPKHAELPFG